MEMDIFGLKFTCPSFYRRRHVCRPTARVGTAFIQNLNCHLISNWFYLIRKYISRHVKHATVSVYVNFYWYRWKVKISSKKWRYSTCSWLPMPKKSLLFSMGFSADSRRASLLRRLSWERSCWPTERHSTANCCWLYQWQLDSWTFLHLLLI